MLIAAIDSYWIELETDDYNKANPHDQMECVIGAQANDHSHDRYMLISGCTLACSLLQFLAILWMQDCCSFPILYFVIAFTNITLIKDAIPEIEEAAKNICTSF